MRVAERGPQDKPAVIEGPRPPVVSIVAIGRMLLFWLSFLAAGGGVWFVADRAVDRARIEPVALGFGLHDYAALYRRQNAGELGPHRIAFVGDSTLMAAEGMRRARVQSLPGRVSLALQKYGERGERLRLRTFCLPGLGPAGMFYASQTIIDTRPERILLSLSLRNFGSVPMRTFGYPESAGWLGAAQLLQALTLPLFAAGVTADRLLLYNAIVASGAQAPWRAIRQLQARAFKLYEPACTWADTKLGSDACAALLAELRLARWTRNVIDVRGRPRNTRAVVENSLRPLLAGLAPDHPNLRILAAVLARFRKAQIPTLVYLEPFNIQYARELGLPLARLPRSLQTIRRVVEREGAQLLDMHAALPDAAFRDQGDHYTFSGEPNGTYLLARRLAEQLVANEPSEQARGAIHAVQ